MKQAIGDHVCCLVSVFGGCYFGYLCMYSKGNWPLGCICVISRGHMSGQTATRIVAIIHSIYIYICVCAEYLVISNKALEPNYTGVSFVVRNYGTPETT